MVMNRISSSAEGDVIITNRPSYRSLCNTIRRKWRRPVVVAKGRAYSHSGSGG
jgi:hypothetical protein